MNGRANAIGNLVQSFAGFITTDQAGPISATAYPLKTTS
jgi:hypothetical protein